MSQPVQATTRVTHVPPACHPTVPARPCLSPWAHTDLGVPCCPASPACSGGSRWLSGRAAPAARRRGAENNPAATSAFIPVTGAFLSWTPHVSLGWDGVGVRMGEGLATGSTPVGCGCARVSHESGRFILLTKTDHRPFQATMKTAARQKRRRASVSICKQNKTRYDERAEGAALGRGPCTGRSSPRARVPWVKPPDPPGTRVPASHCSHREVSWDGYLAA